MATSDTEPFTTGEGVIQETVAEHKVFPPFDSTTFASQLLWFAITFVAFYYLMAKVALPRISRILSERSGRIAEDIETANRFKQESEQAGAAYEKALGEARANANRIADGARDTAKAAAAKQRSEIEADLGRKLQEAEVRISDIKSKALSEVGAIASDAAGAVVAALSDVRATASEVEGAVGEALAERNVRAL
jgi:F-type H+-transporting ATPase subunit b